MKEKKKKILVVDDAPLMLRNLKNMLDQKYDVVLATSGKQALHIMPEEKPDLVLLDYEMPEMDGNAVFEAMLQDPETKEIPVLFLTSNSKKSTILSILKSKPAGYILKPAEQNNLLDTIQKILKK